VTQALSDILRAADAEAPHETMSTSDQKSRPQDRPTFCSGLTNELLRDKVVLITGASSGFGRSIALAFAEHGAYIVSADLSPLAPRQITSKRHDGNSDGTPSAPTVELINKLFPAERVHHSQEGDDESASGLEEGKAEPVRAFYVRCDVTSPEDVEHAVAETVRRFERLDVMVNNAGVAAEATLDHEIRGGARKVSLRVHEAPVSSWERTMDVNGKGVWLGCKFAIAQMLAQEPVRSVTESGPRKTGARGWVINMSSIAALVGLPGSSVYCASKGAVTQMTKAIALEYARDGICVNCINPAFADTGLLEGVLESAEVGRQETQRNLRNSIPMGRLGTAEDVARAAIFLVQDNWVTGHALVVDGGYVAQ
jgi:NAD(P)-dependent dehydrogenase (short-subunit alcohol dehydrogenase family)